MAAPWQVCGPLALPQRWSGLARLQLLRIVAQMSAFFVKQQSKNALGKTSTLLGTICCREGSKEDIACVDSARFVLSARW